MPPEHLRRRFRVIRRPRGGPSALLWVSLSAGVALPLCLAMLLALASIPPLVAAASFFHAITADLPRPEQLAARSRFQTTQILARDGTVLFELFSEGKRTVVPLEHVSPHLIAATLATEDAAFYENPGVDVRGIARAALQNLRGGEVVAGGSTITQQLIKNTLLDPEERYERSVVRKLREIVLALELSRVYSKDQILEMYLNEIYYGNLAYGVEAAAQVYFGKPASALTLAESALLAGLPQAPAQYDPFRNPDAARARQSEVLDLMVRHRFITQAEADQARAERLRFSPSAATTTMLAPHFVMYVRQLLEERYGERETYTRGLRVYTTLDLRLQQIAEGVVRDHLDTLRASGASNAAVVAIDPTTGEVLAMVGSPDYFDEEIDGQVNMAVAPRQPGSAIKPLVYLAAFARGYGPATVVIDQPTDFPDGAGRPPYRPRNHDGRHRGPVTLRRALGNSLNIPAVKTLQFVGLPQAVETARLLGLRSLKSHEAYGLSFTLGGGEVRLVELTAAYAVLANNGQQVPVSPISRIEDGEGTVLWEHQPRPQQIVDPRLTFLVTDILSDNNARLETFGPNSPLKLSRPAAAKTGSTDDYRDSWTVGYTPDLVVGVWVGNADNRPMENVWGSSGAGRIWHRIMEAALEGRPARPFPQPEGLVRATVCAENGFLPTPDCPRTVTDWFLPEFVPTERISPNRRVAVCTASNKLATASTPLEAIEFRPALVTSGGDRAAVPIEPCDAPPQPVALPWERETSDHDGPTPEPRGTPQPSTAPTPTPSPRQPSGAPATPGAGAAGHEVGAAILDPLPNQRVRGVVPIVGTATRGHHPTFQFYKVEYGHGPDPDQWFAVSTVKTEPVERGLLDEWDTAGLSPGQYTLLLTVVDHTGNYQQHRVTVTLQPD